MLMINDSKQKNPRRLRLRGLSVVDSGARILGFEWGFTPCFPGSMPGGSTSLITK